MIVLPDRNIVVITPPKTASSSLHDVLCSPSRNAIRVATADRDKHTTSVPPEYAGFRALYVTRNPYDRAVSLWHDYCRACAYYGAGSPSFRVYLVALPNLEQGTPGHWFWVSTLAQLQDAGAQSAEPVQIERAADWLPLLGLHSLPRHNESWRRQTAAYYDGETAARVREYYAADFARYDYPENLLTGTRPHAPRACEPQPVDSTAGRQATVAPD